MEARRAGLRFRRKGSRQRDGYQYAPASLATTALRTNAHIMRQGSGSARAHTRTSNTHCS